MPRQVNAARSLLASRSGSSRRTIRWALTVLASQILGRPVKRCENVAFHRFRYQHIAGMVPFLRDKYDPATINFILAAWRAVMRQAWKLDLIDGETLARCVAIDSQRFSRLPRGRVLTTAELRELVQHCESDRSVSGAHAGAILALGLFGGLRRQEMVDLPLEAVDLEADQVRVMGKGRKERIVHLSSRGIELMRTWLVVRGTEPGLLLWSVLRGVLQVGKPLSTGGVWWALQRRARVAELGHMTPHDLRRTCATLLRRRGFDVLQVRDYLGHTSVDTTALYLREDLAARRRQVDDIFSEIGR